jgi:hypothetical protein
VSTSIVPASAPDLDTPSVRESLLPKSLADAGLRPLREFRRRYENAVLLLVQLKDEQLELEAGLASIGEQHRETAFGALRFKTNKIELSEVRAELAYARLHGNEPGLAERLMKARHFGVLLAKRNKSAPFQERVSIGRTRSADILLRHESVSKLQAWFERNAEGALFITDAGSTNGTRVQARPLTPREPVQVNPGSVIHFGSVMSTLCTADMLWKALHARR